MAFFSDVYQRFFNLDEKAPIVSFCGGAWFSLLAAIEMEVPYFCLDPNKSRRGTLLKHNSAFANWIGKCCSTEAISAFVDSMEDCVSLCEADFEKFKEDQDQRIESPTLAQEQYSEEEEQIQEEEEEDNFDRSQLEDVSEEEKSMQLQTTQPSPKAPATKLVITQNSKKIVSVPLPVPPKPAGKRPHTAVMETPSTNQKRKKT